MEAMASATSQVDGMRARGSRYQPPAEVCELSAAVLGNLNPMEALLAPPKFWAAGDVSLLGPTMKRVAIIGSRDASEDARKRASKLSRQLCEAGVIVVSGLAKGIDRAAHDSAIATGGHTIAIIGTPIDRCYPIEHADLQREIYRRHLLVSQFAAGTRTFPSHFIERNRFMSVVAQATVVVEAGDTSGTLSQAAETQRLGKPLFIMRSVLENKSLTWPAKFLHPKTGRPAHVLEDVSQVLAAL